MTYDFGMYSADASDAESEMAWFSLGWNWSWTSMLKYKACIKERVFAVWLNTVAWER